MLLWLICIEHPCLPPFFHIHLRLYNTSEFREVCVCVTQGSSSWGRSLTKCWQPRSMLLPWWQTLTRASPITQQWGTLTMVSRDLSGGAVCDRKVSFRELKRACNQRLLHSGNLFVVQWDNVHLKDREDEGSFTFQAVLHRNGTIVFNYRDVSKRLRFQCSGRWPCGVDNSRQTWSFRFLCSWWESIPQNIQSKSDCRMHSWLSSLHCPQVSSLKHLIRYSWVFISTGGGRVSIQGIGPILALFQSSGTQLVWAKRRSL